GAGRKLCDNLLDDRKGLEDFFSPHGKSALHVAFGKDGHCKLNLIVEGVWKITAQVVVETGSAARNTHDTEVARDFRRENASGFESVASAGRLADQFDQRLKLRL